MVENGEIRSDTGLGMCAIRVDELSESTFISNRQNIKWAELPDEIASSMAGMDTMTFLPFENIKQALRTNSAAAPTWVVRDVEGKECQLQRLVTILRNGGLVLASQAIEAGNITKWCDVVSRSDFTQVFRGRSIKLVGVDTLQITIKLAKPDPEPELGLGGASRELK